MPSPEQPTLSSKLWQEIRSEFNHDWLKNRYLTALDGWLRILDSNGKSRDLQLERTFVPLRLPEWEEQRVKATFLIQNFEQKMSPREMLNLLPLSRCEAATRLWLGDLVHELWLIRRPVKQWVADADRCLNAAEDAYVQLRNAMLSSHDLGSVEALRVFGQLFIIFRDECQNLSLAIEKFPSEIELI